MPPLGQNCGNCKAFILLPGQSQKGLCRIEPPRNVNNYIEYVADDGRWPLVLQHEWCGKWEKDNN